MPEAEGGPLAKLSLVLADSCGPRLGVQLRAKNASAQALLGWGRELRAQTSASGSALAVNGRADVAAIIGADAIHLPEAGVPVEAVRSRWPSVWIGVSRHDRDGLHEAANQGATYAFLGPVFDVPGKNPALGIDGFRRAREGLTIPVFALGGDRTGARGGVDCGGRRRSRCPTEHLPGGRPGGTHARVSAQA